MAPIVPLALAAAGVAYYLIDRARFEGPDAPLNQTHLPKGVSAKDVLKTVGAKNGRQYTIYGWPPTKGKQFLIAVSRERTGGWVSYWYDTKSKTRKFYRGYANGGTKAKSDAIVAQIMSDWKIGR